MLYLWGGGGRWVIVSLRFKLGEALQHLAQLVGHADCLHPVLCLNLEYLVQFRTHPGLLHPLFCLDTAEVFREGDRVVQLGGKPRDVGRILYSKW